MLEQIEFFIKVVDFAKIFLFIRQKLTSKNRDLIVWNFDEIFSIRFINYSYVLIYKFRKPCIRYKAKWRNRLFERAFFIPKNRRIPSRSGRRKLIKSSLIMRLQQIRLHIISRIDFGRFGAIKVRFQLNHT